MATVTHHLLGISDSLRSQSTNTAILKSLCAGLGLPPGFNLPLKNKPVLIMTSSPGVLGGVRAQSQLRETLSATLSRDNCGPRL